MSRNPRPCRCGHWPSRHRLLFHGGLGPCSICWPTDVPCARFHPVKRSEPLRARRPYDVHVGPVRTLRTGPPRAKRNPAAGDFLQYLKDICEPFVPMRVLREYLNAEIKKAGLDLAIPRPDPTYYLGVLDTLGKVREHFGVSK